MAVVVVDASVLISYMGDDSGHDAAVDAIARHANDTLVIPASVWAEILVGPIRAGPRAVDELLALIDDSGMQICDLSREIAARAAELRATALDEDRNLRLPDALAIATGELVDADVILTGDHRCASASPLVRVIGA